MMMNSTFTIVGNGAGNGIRDTSQYTRPRTIMKPMSEISIVYFLVVTI